MYLYISLRFERLLRFDVGAVACKLLLCRFQIIERIKPVIARRIFYVPWNEDKPGFRRRSSDYRLHLDSSKVRVVSARLFVK